MKLLLINANTSQSITDLLLREGRKIASSTTELAAVTARFGGRYVATRATYAIASHAALDVYAEYGHDADVVALACFGDPGLAALKEIASQPVVGMAEASCLEAAAKGRFAIVTGGARWASMLREFVATMGLAEQLATVETVAPSGADIARDPEAALALLEAACRQCVDQGAESVILGGAGLAGLADRIASRVPLPVIDSLRALIARAELIAPSGRAANPVTPAAETALPETIGLSSSLAARLGSP